MYTWVLYYLYEWDCMAFFFWVNSATDLLACWGVLIPGSDGNYVQTMKFGDGTMIMTVAQKRNR